MRNLFMMLSALAVMALAVWAYQENYATQDAARHAATLSREIGHLRHELALLHAEWAWLNRPERLLELADLNFDRLGLLPFAPEQYGMIDQVAYPTLLSTLLPVDVAAVSPDGEQLP